MSGNWYEKMNKLRGGGGVEGDEIPVPAKFISPSPAIKNIHNKVEDFLLFLYGALQFDLTEE
jgi:hypothetical protein